MAKLLIIVDVDVCPLPLASGNLALEHDVDLAVRAMLHLGQLEVCRDQTEEARGAPDVTTFASDYAIVSGIPEFG